MISAPFYYQSMMIPMPQYHQVAPFQPLVPYVLQHEYVENFYCSDSMDDFCNEADEAFLAHPSSPQFIQVGGCTYFPTPLEEEDNDERLPSPIESYLSYEYDEAFLVPPSPSPSPQFLQVGGCTYFPAPLEEEDNDERLPSPIESYLSYEYDEAFLVPPSPSPSPQFLQVGGCTYFPAPLEEEDNDERLPSPIESYLSYEYDEAFLVPPSPSPSPQFLQVGGCTYFNVPMEEEATDEDVFEVEEEYLPSPIESQSSYEYDDNVYDSDSPDDFSNEGDEAFLAPPSPPSPQFFQMGGCTYFPAPLEDEEDNDEGVSVLEEECLPSPIVQLPSPIEQLLQQHDTPCFLRGFRPAQLRDHDEPALSDAEVNSLHFLTLTRPQGEDQYTLTEEEIDDFVANQLRNFNTPQNGTSTCEM